MKNTNQTNESPIRWSTFKAAREFGLHRMTLANRLAAAGERPGRDGKFTTQQIVRAVYDDSYHAKIGLIRERRRAAEMENTRTRAELVSVEDATKISRAWAKGIRRVIVASPLLPPDAKENILAVVDRVNEVDFSQLAEEALPDSGEATP